LNVFHTCDREVFDAMLTISRAVCRQEELVDKIISKDVMNNIQSIWRNYAEQKIDEKYFFGLSENCFL
jgi:hypothetical protein